MGYMRVTHRWCTAAFTLHTIFLEQEEGGSLPVVILQYVYLGVNNDTIQNRSYVTKFHNISFFILIGLLLKTLLLLLLL
jgi:hypothetical protein